MKKILLLLLSLVLSFSSYITFAETWNTDEAKLSVSEEKVSIWDNFSLTLLIPISNEANVWDVNMQWLDKFQNFWSTSSFRFENINWNQKWAYDVIINLKPTDFWKFILWPASIKIWDKTIISNTVEIEVIWSNQVPTSSGNQSENNSLASTWKTEMQDINDIKWPKNFFNFSFWFILIFLVCLFFIWFYYLIKYYLLWKEEESKTKKVVQKIETKENYFIEKINKIEKNIDLYDKSEFLALVNDLLREFLEYKWLKYARNMTFKELELHKNMIEKEFFKILQETYFEEFRDNSNDWEIDRKGILKEVRKQLK